MSARASQLAMATSSWRLEDLQQLEELGLAGQLESTRLQEEGAAAEKEQQGHPVVEQDWYTMSDVLSDLLMTEATPPTAPALPLTQSSQPMVVETTLIAPTANGVKHGNPAVTYINRGQWYEVHFKPCVQDIMNNGTFYKCVLSLGFSELRMRNSEHELLDKWSKDHPCERLLDIDRRGCEGVSHMKDADSFNSLSLLWQPRQRAIITVKINCLSSEFAAKKHGGEKGILLQLDMDVYSVDHEEREQHLQRSGCNIKVFKDKGGDRKQKQDQLKMEKLTPDERAKYMPSLDVSHFLLLPSSSQPLSSTLQSSPSPCRPPQHHSSPISPLMPPSHQCADLGVMSSIQEARCWLTSHHFSAYLSIFASYSGADLLRLSRRDLVELCGPGDGIRLFNALRSRTLRTLYVCLADESVYQALCLEQLTADELLCKLSEKVGIQPSHVSCVLQLTSSGLLVMVDDMVVRNFYDEDSFVVSAVKEEATNAYQLLLRDHTHNSTSSNQLQATPLSLAGSNRTDLMSVTSTNVEQKL